MIGAKQMKKKKFNLATSVNKLTIRTNKTDIQKYFIEKKREYIIASFNEKSLSTSRFTKKVSITKLKQNKYKTTKLRIMAYAPSCIFIKNRLV